MSVNIVGIAIAPSNNHVYTWFDDYTVTSGSLERFGCHRTSYEYKLPSGEKASDIVGIAIGHKDKCFAWYKDGKVSAGSSNNLGKDMYEDFQVAPGRQPSDILDIGILNNKYNYCYAWYKNGLVSAGSLWTLDKHEPQEAYYLYNKQRDDVVGMAVDSSNSCYAWYKDGTYSVGDKTWLYNRPQDQPNAPDYTYEVRLKLPVSQLKKFLISELGTKLKKFIHFHFADQVYYCPPYNDVERIVQASAVQSRNYILEKHDCDDFALSLKYEAVRDAYLNGLRRDAHAIAIMHVDDHCMNMAVTSKKEIFFIEPQTDEIFGPNNFGKHDKDDYIYMIYM